MSRQSANRQQRIILRAALSDAKNKAKDALRIASNAYNDTPSQFLQERIEALKTRIAVISDRLLRSYEAATDAPHLSIGAYFEKDLNSPPFPSFSHRSFVSSRLWSRSQAANNPLEPHVSLSLHYDMVKIRKLDGVSLETARPGAGGIRGAIRGFSNASRRRMLEFLAMVRFAGQLLFLTLTYPDNFPFEVEEWKVNFERFRRRFEYKFPRWRMVWRMELKARKSGENRGQIAPHYHFIIFLDGEEVADIESVPIKHNGSWTRKTVSHHSEAVQEWALQAWYEIVGSGDAAHLEHGAFCVALKSRRHAMSYISKYVGKIGAADDDLAVGRRWGRIGQFDTSASTVVLLTKAEYAQLLRDAREWLLLQGRNVSFIDDYFSLDQGITFLGLGDHDNELLAVIQLFLVRAAAAAGLPPQNIISRIAHEDRI